MGIVSKDYEGICFDKAILTLPCPASSASTLWKGEAKRGARELWEFWARIMRKFWVGALQGLPATPLPCVLKFMWIYLPTSCVACCETIRGVNLHICPEQGDVCAVKLYFVTTGMHVFSIWVNIILLVASQTNIAPKLHSIDVTHLGQNKEIQ